MARRRRKPYPRNSDVARAIIEVLCMKPLLHPQELPGEVKSRLEKLGYYPGLVSEKRVWRIYREMVLRGKMADTLEVVVE